MNGLVGRGIRIHITESFAGFAQRDVFAFLFFIECFSVDVTVLLQL